MTTASARLKNKAFKIAVAAGLGAVAAVPVYRMDVANSTQRIELESNWTGDTLRIIHNNSILLRVDPQTKIKLERQTDSLKSHIEYQLGPQLDYNDSKESDIDAAYMFAPFIFGGALMVFGAGRERTRRK
jgi:hypothetical protein